MSLNDKCETDGETMHLKHLKSSFWNMYTQGSRLTFCTGCTGAPNFFFLGVPAQKLGAPKFPYRQY